MILALLLSMAADPDPLIAEHLRRTRAEVPCEAPGSTGDVVVCGRREADRFRPTFVATDIRDAVFLERTRLMRSPFPKCGVTGPFLVSETCGKVGVTVSTDGSAVRVRTRPLAP